MEPYLLQLLVIHTCNRWANLFRLWLYVTSCQTQGRQGFQPILNIFLVNKLYHPPDAKPTPMLTYSIVQSRSWAANWFADSQEIPRISRNPQVHYRTHKCPPPVLILGQPNPVHTPNPTSWRSILILSTHLCLGLPSGLFPSGFPTKTLHTPSPHPYAPHGQPISFFSILSPAQYWVRSTDHLAPRYAISSIPPLPRPS